MSTLEERVAYLEGQMTELSNAVVQVREAIRDLEQRMNLRFEGIERRVEALDDKVSRQFVWLAGMQVTTLIAVIGALLARG